MPQQSSKAKRQPGRKFGIVLFLLLLVVIIAIAFMVYLKSEGIDIKNIKIKELFQNGIFQKSQAPDSEENLEINYEVKEHPAFIVYKDLLVKCETDSFKGINKKGEEVLIRSIGVNNPLIKTNGPELLIADLGGRDIYVMNGWNIKWDEKLSGNIINAEISESGHVTVIHEAKGFKGVVKVFDPRGIEMFSRNIAENFVLTAKVAPSGEQLLINSINTSGININPSLEFFDMMGNPFAARTPGENQIFAYASYLDDDSLLTASSSALVYYDKERNEKWRKEFKEIYSVGISLGKYIAAAVSKEGEGNGLEDGLNEIQIFNRKGQQTAAFQVEGRVENIRTYSDIIAVNTIREVCFINTKGVLVGKYTSKPDIKDVYFFNKLQAAIVTKNSVAIIEIS
jgi:hypothetical protein